MGIEEDSELGIQDTQTQTVCQLAEQKVLHIKGTQLCLPHLFITFSLIQFPFPIPPLNFSFSLGKSESPCWYFVSISLGSIENCFDFYCLSALNPCAMHSKQGTKDEDLWEVYIRTYVLKDTLVLGNWGLGSV